jgi:hypothetical protein
MVTKPNLQKLKTTMHSRCSYPLLKDEVPRSPAQRVPDEELDDVQREVADDVVQPDDAGPAPSDALDRSKRPVGIHSNQSSDLQAWQTWAGYGTQHGSKAWTWIETTHQLRHQESRHQQEPRTLHKGPAARSRHEDKGLADRADLKVYRRGKHLEIVVGKAFDMEQSLQTTAMTKDEWTHWIILPKTLKMLNKLLGLHTGKKSVLYAAQKKMTVIMAK